MISFNDVTLPVYNLHLLDLCRGQSCPVSPFLLKYPGPKPLPKKTALGSSWQRGPPWGLISHKRPEIKLGNMKRQGSASLKKVKGKTGRDIVANPLFYSVSGWWAIFVSSSNPFVPLFSLTGLESNSSNHLYFEWHFEFSMSSTSETSLSNELQSSTIITISQERKLEPWRKVKWLAQGYTARLEYLNSVILLPSPRIFRVFSKLKLDIFSKMHTVCLF